MSRFLTFPAGGQAKWLVLAACLLILVGSGAANLPGRYTDAENNESTSYLPGDAESTKVLALTEELQGGEQAPVVIVYRREGGLTERRPGAHRGRPRELNRTVEENPGGIYRAVSPFAEPRPRRPATRCCMIGNITGDGEGSTILDPIADIRDRVQRSGRRPARSKVTGPAGFSADVIKVFEGINGTLLGAALLLVVVLLILIYRSPVFWLDPALRRRSSPRSRRAAIGYGARPRSG